MKTLLVKITSAYVSVDGYFKSNGTYVMPHFRALPDSSIYNNFSYWK